MDARAEERDHIHDATVVADVGLALLVVFIPVGAQVVRVVDLVVLAANRPKAMTKHDNPSNGPVTPF